MEAIIWTPCAWEQTVLDFFAECDPKTHSLMRQFFQDSYYTARIIPFARFEKLALSTLQAHPYAHVHGQEAEQVAAATQGRLTNDAMALVTASLRRLQKPEGTRAVILFDVSSYNPFCFEFVGDAQQFAARMAGLREEARMDRSGDVYPWEVDEQSATEFDAGPTWYRGFWLGTEDEHRAILDAFNRWNEHLRGQPIQLLNPPIYWDINVMPL
jgi:hypothetical protein